MNATTKQVFDRFTSRTSIVLAGTTDWRLNGIPLATYGGRVPVKQQVAENLGELNARRRELGLEEINIQGV